MSFKNHRSHRDKSEPKIVEAIEKAGWSVWRKLPTDLLCWKRGKGFRVIEAKTPNGKEPKARIRKDQQAQNDFIELTGIPRVISAEQAIDYLERT